MADAAWFTSCEYLTPMDPLDLEYLLEQTAIVRRQRLSPSLVRSYQSPFSVIFEDMDVPGRVFIQEGTIFCRQLELLEAADELEGFSPEAVAALTQLQQRVPVFKARVGLGNVGGDRHEVHTSIEAALERLKDYPANETRLIVQTLQDKWEIGLMWAAFSCLEGDFRSPR